MIVYMATKSQFVEDVLSNHVEQMIQAAVKKNLKFSAGASEVRSWEQSLGFMHRILVSPEIPDDAGIAIEFSIPRSAKRIDFILTGLDSEKQRSAVVIELKQWEKVQTTEKDAIVRTYLGGMERETTHPSYQAWSYAALLEDFNEAVRSDPIHLKPCAYLHNCTTAGALTDPFYKDHIAKAPVFTKPDAVRLKDFICKHVKYGDKGETIFRIDGGKISPSKSLADALVSMLSGNTEFVVVDDQKLVFETAKLKARTATNKNKQVLIVDGGPGTGKSVVAINLLADLTARGQVVQYVTKNAAPRTVYESKLTGTFSKSRISNLFSGSGAYYDAEPDVFDALIVDEAHRLNAKSGMFQHMGENQIKELIRASKCTIFFIDEDQRVTFKDIGDKATIRKFAAECGAAVEEMELASQFRCNGSDGYLAWVDDLLQVRPTVNQRLEGLSYEFEVCESPNMLRAAILAHNAVNNRARMVAGYCWDWVSKSDPQKLDIVFPVFGFAARWNLGSDGNLWIVKPESVSEIGCIHTCQGLELDYVGVIVGPDLIVRDGVVQTDALARSRQDSSIKGYKAMLKQSPHAAHEKAAKIIKNTYRTLMTRARKGCYVFSADPETNEYFRERI